MELSGAKIEMQEKVFAANDVKKKLEDARRAHAAEKEALEAKAEGLAAELEQLGAEADELDTGLVRATSELQSQIEETNAQAAKSAALEQKVADLTEEIYRLEGRLAEALAAPAPVESHPLELPEAGGGGGGGGGGELSLAKKDAVEAGKQALKARLAKMRARKAASAK